jgi:hypothetical protein
MDPYLEDLEFFPDLHDRLITRLSETLQATLPARYYTQTRSRVWVELSERGMTPDVSVLRSAKAAPPAPANGGAVAGALAIVAPLTIPVPQDETREPFLEVCTWRGGRHVVTAVEILSPSNKTPGEHGREQYRQKQREVLASQVHLVEIDLLRGGVHTTAIPHSRLVARAGTFAYHVCLHRFDDLETFFVYPIQLEQRLPVIAIPLLPGDGEVPLDLQAAFDHCYDLGPYRRLPVYQETKVTPPLSPEQAAWAEGLLRQQGLLPPA